MKRMLSAPNVYLYREFVDFRKSINGLTAIIESETDLPLGTGALFLFTNKQRDKIKVLYWDKAGFALWKNVIRTTGKCLQGDQNVHRLA